MGPSALRVAGLQSRLKQLGRQVEDIGNVQVRQPEEQPYGEKKAKYLDEIAEACKGLADIVAKTLDEEKAAIRRLNKAAFDDVVYAPTGFFLVYQAWRKNVSGIVKGPLPFFWNVNKASA